MVKYLYKKNKNTIKNRYKNFKTKKNVYKSIKRVKTNKNIMLGGCNNYIIPIHKKIVPALTTEKISQKNDNTTKITTYATKENFINAQKNGFTIGTTIPNNNATFDREGKTFDNVLHYFENLNSEKRNAGEECIWYILPSDIFVLSKSANFFKVSPGPSDSKLTIKEYLDDDILRTNYIKIINTINNKLQVNKDKISMATTIGYIIGSNNYHILQNSITNFEKEITQILEINKVTPDQNIKKITDLEQIIDIIKNLIEIMKDKNRIL